MNSVIGKGELILMTANTSMVFIESTVIQAYSIMIHSNIETVYASSYIVFTCLMTVLAYFNSI
jgi:hypothetical protein